MINKNQKITRKNIDILLNNEISIRIKDKINNKFTDDEVYKWLVENK